ncbi:hypothetical protein SCHPADRAFT_852771 [Schizopora paradoxa]|uniref:PIG-F-domain-containing protein n=1 Tax=Schizopora paradoxa TaxID=27342 RepID=A0A0H2RMU7_9AGAM|nr:hypothetical protein SCHPADRAFT_852771 [Schizopora paradoxa]
MPSSFPFSRFSSLLGVHSLLVIFTAGWLPRSSKYLGSLPPQASSKDRPQHPFLHPITADPLLTLGWLCIGILAVNATWAPFMKREIQYSRIALYGEDEEAKIKRRSESGRNMLGALVDALVSTSVLALLLHIVLVLFGASIVHYFSRTFALALLIALLAAFTPAYVLGRPSLASNSSSLVHRLTWLRLFVEFSLRNEFERSLVYPSVGAVVGAWVGAIPIALDWDRPWQAWPLTVAYGAVGGYIIASWAAFVVNGVLFLAEESRQYDRDTAEAVTAAAEAESSSKKARKKVKSRKSGQ